MGERLTLDRLYRTHYRWAIATVIGLGARYDQAEDLVQDAFERIAAGRFRGETNDLPKWLYVVLRNLAFKQQRRARIQRLLTPLLGPPAPDRAAEAMLLGQEELRLCHRALEHLRPRYREVLVLADFDEMRLPEIAALLGISLDATRKRLEVARRTFRKVYARYASESRSRRRRSE